jgi:hypothetical protein
LEQEREKEVVYGFASGFWARGIWEFDLLDAKLGGFFWKKPDGEWVEGEGEVDVEYEVGWKAPLFWKRSSWVVELVDDCTDTGKLSLLSSSFLQLALRACAAA